jgi:hypothetical protein
MRKADGVACRRLQYGKMRSVTALECAAQADGWKHNDARVLIAYRIDALYMPYVHQDCSYAVLRACGKDTPAQAGLNHYLHE